MSNKKLSPKSVLKDFTSKNNKCNNIDDLTLKLGNFSIDDVDGDVDNPKYVQLKCLLDSVCTCQISDAFNGISRRSGVIKALKSINGKTAYGRIYTGITKSDDWGTSLFTIDNAKKGDIIFLLSEGKSSAVWGELASTCAMEKGVKATAIYGSCRDIDEILDLDFPVFACEKVPNAGSPLGLGKVNIDLNIEEGIIKPGDFFFGDESGVVVIPQELFDKVIMETLAIKIKESKILEQLKEGKALSEIVGLK